MKKLCLLFFCAMIAATVRAEEAHIAVAANFAAPVQRLAAEFQQQSGHVIHTALGATGALTTQIRNGAPFDALLAADAASPAALANEGLALAPFTYATGRLALWSAREHFVDAQGEVLRQGGFRHLAIANPRIAPYGAAALETLEKMHLAQTLKPRLVEGNNSAQAHQFIVSGNAELGFVALAQIMSAGRVTTGSAWIVPASLHAPLRQDAVLLKRGENNLAAREFLAYLRGDAARKILRGFGYE